MATTTIKTSGGDHATIAAWEADTDVSLSAVEFGELYNKAADAAWDEHVTFAGATGLSATVYRKLIVPVAERSSFAGAPDGCNVQPTSTGHVFVIAEDFFRLVGHHIHDWVGSSAEGVRVSAADNVQLDTLCICDGTANNADGIYPDDCASKTLFIRNCFVYNIDRGGLLVQSETSLTVYCYGCSFWKCNFDGGTSYGAVGYDSTSSNNTSSVIHCINTTADSGFDSQEAYHGGGTSGQEGEVRCTNCADYGTSITDNAFVIDVANNLESVTQADQFVSLSGGIDLHLKAGSALEDAGKDLDSDPTWPVTLDIDGDTRHATAPDIGADELLGAVTVSFPPANRKMLHLIGR